MQEEIPVLVIVGPTAVGKTEVAVCVAERLDGEIISADSRQVYRGMDVGTAKPEPEHFRRVPHHLVDVADPAEQFSAVRFSRLARIAVSGIHERERIPIVVGGSGLYLRALLDGLFLGPPASAGLRGHLREVASVLGTGELHRRLGGVDPQSADRIHPNDLVRLVRALEVFLLTGDSISRLQERLSEEKPLMKPTMIGLARDREDLYHRIDIRVDRMLEAGLLDEVRGLVAANLQEAPGLATLGYKEMMSHLRHESSLEEAIQLMKRNSRRFAKRQITWFSKDPRIDWIALTPASTAEDISSEVIARFRGREA